MTNLQSKSAELNPKEPGVKVIGLRNSYPRDLDPARVWSDDAQAQARSLGACLPRLRKPLVQAYNKLFHSTGELLTEHSGQQARWHLWYSAEREPIAPGDSWVQFERDQKTYWLQARSGFRHVKVGDRYWHEYSEKSQVLAWALAFEPFIQHANLLLNEVWMPVRIQSEPPPELDTGSYVECDWDYLDAGESRLSGKFYWSPEQIDQLELKSAPQWDTKASGLLDSLPIPMQFHLPGYFFPDSEFKLIEAGDLLMVPGSVQWGFTLYFKPVFGRQGWTADLKEGRLIVKQEFDKVEAGLAQPETAAGSDLKDIGIELSFQLGNINLPLAELRQLQTGYIIELPQGVEQAEVKVLANGSPVGGGRLIAIGDRLGVQLTQWRVDGV